MVLVKPSFLIDTFFDLITLLLIIGALLTWIPRMPVHKVPVSWLFAFCDMFFRPFRGLIPVLGGFDFSPMLALILLQVIKNVLCEILIRFQL